MFITILSIFGFSSNDQGLQNPTGTRTALIQPPAKIAPPTKTPTLTPTSTPEPTPIPIFESPIFESPIGGEQDVWITNNDEQEPTPIPMWGYPVDLLRWTK